jgi:hypothetical protein
MSGAPPDDPASGDLSKPPRGSGRRAKRNKEKAARAADAAPAAVPPPAPAPAATSRAADMFFQKGDASANSFRPFYWTYDRTENAPPTEAPPEGAAAPAEQPEMPRRRSRRRRGDDAENAASPPPAPEPPEEAPPPEAERQTEASRREAARSVIRELRARARQAEAAPPPSEPSAPSPPEPPPPESPPEAEEPPPPRQRSARSLSLELQTRGRRPEEPAPAPTEQPLPVSEPSEEPPAAELAEPEPEPSSGPASALLPSAGEPSPAPPPIAEEASAEPALVDDAPNLETPPTLDEVLVEALPVAEEPASAVAEEPSDDPLPEPSTPSDASRSANARSVIRELRARAREAPAATAADEAPAVNAAPEDEVVEPPVEAEPPPLAAAESEPVEAPPPAAEAPASRARAAIREFRARARDKTAEAPEPTVPETSQPPPAPRDDAESSSLSGEGDVDPALPPEADPAVAQQPLAGVGPDPATPHAAGEAPPETVSVSQKAARSVIQELRARARGRPTEDTSGADVSAPATDETEITPATRPMETDPPPSQRAARSVIQELRQRAKGGEPDAPSPPVQAAPAEPPAGRASATSAGTPLAPPRGAKRDANAQSGEDKGRKAARSVIQDVRARAKVEPAPKQGGLGAFLGRLFGKGKRSREEPQPETEVKPSPSVAAPKPPPLELARPAAEAAPPPSRQADQPAGIATLHAVSVAAQPLEAGSAPPEPSALTTTARAMETAPSPVDALELTAAEQIASPPGSEVATGEADIDAALAPTPEALPPSLEGPPESVGEAAPATAAPSADDQVALPETGDLAAEHTDEAFARDEESTADAAAWSAIPDEAPSEVAAEGIATGAAGVDAAALSDDGVAPSALEAVSAAPMEDVLEPAEPAAAETVPPEPGDEPAAEAAAGSIDEIVDQFGDEPVAAAETEPDAGLGLDGLTVGRFAEPLDEARGDIAGDETEAPEVERRGEDVPFEPEPVAAEQVPGLLLSELRAEPLYEGAGEIAAGEAEVASAGDDDLLPEAVAGEDVLGPPAEARDDAVSDSGATEAEVATMWSEAVAAAEPEPAVEEIATETAAVESQADAYADLAASGTEPAASDVVLPEDRELVAAESLPEAPVAALPVEMPDDAVGDAVAGEGELPAGAAHDIVGGIDIVPVAEPAAAWESVPEAFAVEQAAPPADDVVGDVMPTEAGRDEAVAAPEPPPETDAAPALDVVRESALSEPEIPAAEESLPEELAAWQSAEAADDRATGDAEAEPVVAEIDPQREGIAALLAAESQAEAAHDGADERLPELPAAEPLAIDEVVGDIVATEAEGAGDLGATFAGELGEEAATIGVRDEAPALPAEAGDPPAVPVEPIAASADAAVVDEATAEPKLQSSLLARLRAFTRGRRSKHTPERPPTFTLTGREAAPVDDSFRGPAAAQSPAAITTPLAAAPAQEAKGAMPAASEELAVAGGEAPTGEVATSESDPTADPEKSARARNLAALASLLSEIKGPQPRIEVVPSSATPPPADDAAIGDAAAAARELLETALKRVHSARQQRERLEAAAPAEDGPAPSWPLAALLRERSMASSAPGSLPLESAPAASVLPRAELGSPEDIANAAAAARALLEATLENATPRPPPASSPPSWSGAAATSQPAPAPATWVAASPAVPAPVGAPPPFAAPTVSTPGTPAPLPAVAPFALPQTQQPLAPPLAPMPPAAPMPFTPSAPSTPFVPAAPSAPAPAAPERVAYAHEDQRGLPGAAGESPAPLFPAAEPAAELGFPSLFADTPTPQSAESAPWAPFAETPPEAAAPPADAPAFDDIRNGPFPAATDEPFPSILPTDEVADDEARFRPPVLSALDDIREPVAEPDEAPMMAPPRLAVLSALEDIREPSPDEPSFSSAAPASADFAWRETRGEAREEEARPAEMEVDGDALGEAIESVLASKWYGTGEGPGMSVSQRAAAPQPKVARQVTHDSLLAELYSARQGDAPPPGTAPEAGESGPRKSGGNRMFIIICVVVGLLAAAGGAALMSGAFQGSPIAFGTTRR